MGFSGFIKKVLKWSVAKPIDYELKYLVYLNYKNQNSLCSLNILLLNIKNTARALNGYLTIKEKPSSVLLNATS